tara:strand:- start:824 stop:946 length:123 start_codon:yes stop_codon:yes gene_type:complete
MARGREETTINPENPESPYANSDSIQVGLITEVCGIYNLD